MPSDDFDSPMKVAYVAGPYRSRLGAWGVKCNIDAAMAVARELWMKGYVVICPHGNTAFMDGTDTDHVFLLGDLEILRRCDLLVALPGYQSSTGAVAEVEFARERSIPVYEWPEVPDAR